MTQTTANFTTAITNPPSSNGGQHVAEVHIGHLLEQIEQAARQVLSK